MKWKNRNLRALADIVCGNAAHFPYRSSSFITEFFEDCGLDYIHDGSTRWAWVASRLEEVLAQPRSGPNMPPDAFARIIRNVLDRGEAQEGDPDRSKALASLNVVLGSEGWEAFYDENGVGQLRHVATNTIAQMANPHRPLTPLELQRREQLTAYLDKCSEDELIEEVLLPLFRQLGFTYSPPDTLSQLGLSIIRTSSNIWRPESLGSTASVRCLRSVSFCMAGRTAKRLMPSSRKLSKR